MFYKSIAVFIFLLYSIVVYSVKAQGSADATISVVSGTVKNVSGVPLAGVKVSIGEPYQHTVTDNRGQFRLEVHGQKIYTLLFSHLEYEQREEQVDLTEKREIVLLVSLSKHWQELAAVEVVSSVNRQVAERPVLTQVVNTKAVHEQPTTLIELLNRSAGVRIRQAGGLGSNSNLMINGFQNRSIRYFKDGIPLDYLGAGFDLSLVPVNLLERAEVYKGVLPVSLGADALGGAVNLVSARQHGNALGLSYEAGSFGTNRASVNLLHSNEAKHYFVGADAFYNYARNDYPVDVKIIDEQTGRQYDDRVSLFHNAFHNYYAEIFGGLTNISWADELRLGVTTFGIDRQINFGATMNQAIGKATNQQQAISPTVRYRKQALDERLSVDQFFALSFLNTALTDTAQGQYNWLGVFKPSDARLGELNPRGSKASIDYAYYTSRTAVQFVLNSAHRIDFNASLTGFSRVGEDPLGQRFITTGEDVLARKARYDKQVLGLGLTSHVGRAFENQFAVKHYSYQTDATDADYQGIPIDQTNNNSAWGIANALKYTVNTRSYIRLGVESALRLPEQDELFGDGDRKLSNLGLRPERSVNANLGYRLSWLDKHALELNSFYRITKNMIIQLPYNFLFTQSQNIDNVRGIGFEADGEMSLLPGLRAKANFTYQDQRIFKTNNPSLDGARLRNTPYFFANASLEGTVKQLFHERDRLQAYYHYMFVRQYYLDALPRDMEPDGFLGLWGDAKIDAKNIIPNQQLHTVGFTYHPAYQRLSIGAQIKNMFDARVYDNFRVQNPGRSIHVKIMYTLTKP